MPVNYDLDIAGPICQSVEDVATLLTVMKDPSNSALPMNGYTTAMKGEGGWSELRVGTLDPEIFRYDESFQTPVPGVIEQIVS